MKAFRRIAPFIFLLSSISHSQIITYTFDGDVASAATTTTGVVASAVTSNDSTFSFPAGSSGDAISENGWEGSLGDQFFNFSFTVSSGYTLSLTSFDFNHRRGGTGPPTTFEVRSSTVRFAGGWATGTIQSIDNAAVKTTSSFSGVGERSVTLTGLTNVAAGTTVSIRIGTSGATGSSATLLLDDVEVFGSVSAVPEPSSFATLAGLAMLGFAASRRRSRSTLA